MKIMKLLYKIMITSKSQKAFIADSLSQFAKRYAISNRRFMPFMVEIKF